MACEHSLLICKDKHGKQVGKDSYKVASTTCPMCDHISSKSDVWIVNFQPARLLGISIMDGYEYMCPEVKT